MLPTVPSQKQLYEAKTHVWLSLAAGIISFFSQNVGILLAILAIVSGAMGTVFAKKQKKKGAMVGTIIGFALGVISLIAWLTGGLP